MANLVRGRVDTRFLGNPQHTVQWPYARTLYVGSVETNKSDSASLGTNSKNPLETIKQAMANIRTFDGAGHRIIVMPGHVETIDAADELDFDVDHVEVIGLGGGTARPKINFTTTTAANIVISGRGVKLDNFLFNVGITSLVKLASVTGDDCHLTNCRISDGGLVLVDGLVWTGDYGVIRGLYASAPTAGNQSIIQLTGTDQMEVADCVIRCDGEQAAIECVTTLSTMVDIHHNRLETLDANDRCILGMTGLTGWIHNNVCRLATDGQVTWISTPGNAQLFQNYGVNNNGETGILIGTPSV